MPLGIVRSTDGGETWHDFARGFGSADGLSSLGNAQYGNTVVSTLQQNGSYLPYGTDNNAFSGYVDMIMVEDKLVAMGNEGIYVFDQNGDVLHRNLKKNRCGQFAVSGNDLTIYITNENGFEIQKSADFGATWSKVVGGNTITGESDFYSKLKLQDGRLVKNVRHQHYFRALQVAGNTMYVSFNSDRGNTASWDRNYLDWASNVNTAGVAVSHDLGETWLWSFEATHFQQKSYITSGSIAEMNNGIRGNLATVVNKGNPNQAIITNAYTAFQTLDGGLTWKSLESEIIKEEDGRKFYATTGVEPAVQNAFAVDPSNPDHRYAGWTDIGLWESTDGGKSWAKVVFSGIVSNASDAWGVAFDPNNPNIIITSDINSNHYKNAELTEEILNVIYGDPSVASIRGRIIRSTDGGKTWAEATINEVEGFPDTYLKILPTGIVFDPINKNTAYFSSNGLGVLRSTDSGVTWSLMNDGIEMQTGVSGRNGIGAHKLTLATDQKTLFVHTGRTVFADIKRFGDTYSLDLTTNSTTWTKLNRPNDTKSNFYNEGTWFFSIDRAPDGTLYAGTSVRKQVNDAGTAKWLIDGECGGAYVSTDMGTTWRQMYDDIQSIAAVKVDSKNPNRISMATMGKIFVSFKGNNTTQDDWVEVATLPHLTPLDIFEDPINANRLCVMTRGGGTWSFSVPKNLKAAKDLIEADSYTVTQEEANTEDDVRIRLARQINALLSATDVSVTEDNITITEITAAVAGSPETLAGSNGAFTFTVLLVDGDISLSTSDIAGIITATPYTAPPEFAVTIAATTNGMVTADLSSAPVETSVTLTVTPSAGYELLSITACKTDDASTLVETLLIAPLQYQFTMPAYDVTITATFTKTADLTALEAAKTAIEATTFSVAQTKTNDGASVKVYLADTLNTLFNVQVRSTTGTIIGDVTVTAITPAVAGTDATPAGISGSFKFTVTLTKGASTLSTGEIPGVITATSYDVTANDVIETRRATSLQAWTQNGILHIRGLKTGKLWSVYNMYGSLIYCTIAAEPRAAIPLPAQGVYIIKSGSRTAKAKY